MWVGVFAHGSGPPSVVPGPGASASPGKLLDMQILGMVPSNQPSVLTGSPSKDMSTWNL